MRPNTALEAIQFFLIDILAFLFPGATLLLATWLVLSDWIQPAVADIVAIPPSSASDWAIVAVLSYVVGYTVQAVGEIVLIESEQRGRLGFLESLARWARHDTPGVLHRIPKAICRWLLVPRVQTSEELENQIATSDWYKAAQNKLSAYVGTDLSSLNYRELRNVAMSVTANLQNVYRYIYMSLLCLGTGTALLATLVTVGVVAVADASPWADIALDLDKLWWLGPYLAAAIFLLNRRYRYYSIGMRIPFSIALGEIGHLVPSTVASVQEPPPLTADPTATASQPRVYLSGGTRSGWQDEVKARCPNMTFYDPRTHGLTEADQYTIWDLHHVRESNIIFAYMESQNPSGLGLALEIGAGKALGKTIILVDEKSPTDNAFAKYFAIIRQAADVTVQSLDEGIGFLERFQTR